MKAFKIKGLKIFNVLSECKVKNRSAKIGSPVVIDVCVCKCLLSMHIKWIRNC